MPFYTFLGKGSTKIDYSILILSSLLEDLEGETEHLDPGRLCPERCGRSPGSPERSIPGLAGLAAGVAPCGAGGQR